MDLDHAACYRAVRTRDRRFDGRFFVGVKTTGIYCRPICPARTPKRDNIVFFATAAAAQEAGLRPCLRCRPELSPEVAAYSGSAKTVTRALALIAEGALDDDSVDALAARLGLGERQLRRLFEKHVGASPVAVAQTRRVHLAKQLIADTRLSLGQVALAAGFGSVRRFNATFQQLFGKPPSAMRRSSGRTAGITLTLPYAPPYDWPAMLAFFTSRAISGVEHIEDGRYTRVIASDGVYGRVIVEPHPRLHALVATIDFADTQALTGIVARLRRVFDLSADPEAINRHLQHDAALGPLVAARPGLRVPGAWDGFEQAIRAILGQQVSVGAARRLASELVARYGVRIRGAAGALTHAFPTPATLARGVELGMPKARCRAIEAFARATLANGDLFRLGATLEDTIALLRAMPGIGEWTAQYIALRAMREPDAFPAADVGLMRAVADNGRRPTPTELLRRAEPWRPWRAYAAQHLWVSDASMMSEKHPNAA